MSGDDGDASADFQKRRERARESVNALDRERLEKGTDRQAFFNDVYALAKGDPAFVPWADLSPKPQLVEWLGENSRIEIKTSTHEKRRAIDIACGLGDNAEAIAAAGYDVTAFDLSGDAIAWAKERFRETTVDYQVADLFNPPNDWSGAFDLVHECFTLQALPPDMLERTAAAIAGFAAPGADLIVYTRWRPDGAAASGPPWPLEERKLRIFSNLGFVEVSDTRFEIHRTPDRVIPHAFIHWKKRGW